MKKYRAIFFDWDGTATASRRETPEALIRPMTRLLTRGVDLAIVTRTTYENIASGRIQALFSPEALAHLYLGLGHGAFDYAFDGAGDPYLLASRAPNREQTLRLHHFCVDVHMALLKEWGIETDIVFSRANYCKLDVLPHLSRGAASYMQAGEAAALRALLDEKRFAGGVAALLRLVRDKAQKAGLSLRVASDAKYVEIAFGDKGDSVDGLLSRLTAKGGYGVSDCCFWGDEFAGVADGIEGSDASMITEMSRQADFFDVSDAPGPRPRRVVKLGGGVSAFHQFLESQ